MNRIYLTSKLKGLNDTEIFQVAYPFIFRVQQFLDRIFLTVLINSNKEVIHKISLTSKLKALWNTEIC